MPYETVYVPAELFIEHAGVKIYYCYKDNEIDQGCRDYWFDNKEASDDYAGFDVRGLSNQLKLSLPDWRDDESKEAVLIAAIDAGLIKTYVEDEV